MIGPSRYACVCIVRFLLVSLLAFVLLAGSMILLAYGFAYLHDSDWDRPEFLVLGMFCGLIAWWFVAIFHLKHETQSLPISQQELFLVEARSILQEMGYQMVSRQADQLTFHPSFHAFLFGGGIRLEIAGHAANISGPRVSLEIFRRRYRLQHHVQRVQQVLLDQRKITDTRLKRIEVALRLKPEQFEAVRKNIVVLLQKEGEVVCELNLLVQSDEGIREEVVEFQIREWLAQQNIPCDIHKDFVQFVEVVPNTREQETVAI